jgi:pyrimidine deaminase RibD-like protein
MVKANCRSALLMRMTKAMLMREVLLSYPARCGIGPVAEKERMTSSERLIGRLAPDDATAMDFAIAEARQSAEDRTQGTSPPPMVGAVAVRDGVVVGSGHRESGKRHAERVLIESASCESLIGADVFVTLLPCDGCAAELSKTGVRSVTVALYDPHLTAVAASTSILDAAGIEIRPALLDQKLEIRRLNSDYLRKFIAVPHRTNSGDVFAPGFKKTVLVESGEEFTVEFNGGQGRIDCEVHGSKLGWSYLTGTNEMVAPLRAVDLLDLFPSGTHYAQLHEGETAVLRGESGFLKVTCRSVSVAVDCSVGNCVEKVKFEFEFVEIPGWKDRD